MEKGSTNVTEVARSVQLLKIDGFSVTSTMTGKDYIKSRWNVDGYDWEVHLYPSWNTNVYRFVVLKLFLLSEARVDNVRATLSCRLVHPRWNCGPSEQKSVTTTFSRSKTCLAQVFVVNRGDVPGSGYLWRDSLTVECTITVLKEEKEITFPSVKDVSLPMPPSDMPQHFGKLLQSQTGADVTFTVSGESFFAHKLILAARSPVFMAEFFGNMEERSSTRVQIEDMEAPVFDAMLHFIYTDTVPPELDGQAEEATAMAQHLVAAADRYGLDRLKLICESKLSVGICINTAAATLALAEQHNCKELKAKCVEFISRSRENLDAVLATEGYKNLEASCPFLLTELLKAAHGRNK